MDTHNNKHLFSLDELSDYKVASHYHDVRGWKLVDADNHPIGKVDNLLVNKEAKRVVYLDVEVDKNIIEEGHEAFGTSASQGTHEYINKDGENHLIVPIGSVHIDEHNKHVITNEISRDTFRRAKRFSKGHNIDRGYEVQIINVYYPGESTSSTSTSDNDHTFYERRHFNDRGE